MGSAIAPAPTDYRIERCVKYFMIPQDKIHKLWTQFSKYDREGKQCITMDDYFERIIKYPRSGLTDAMFTLIESRSEGVLTFGEFVEVTCTFCCFEQIELLRYFFYILDSNKTGLVEKNEVKHFVQMIWNNDLTSNLKVALAFLDKIDDGDGTFNFREILTLHSKYPNTFFPIFRLQIQMIEHSLGSVWWENHKAMLVDSKEQRQEQEVEAARRRQREQAAEVEAANDDVVLKRMGPCRYYCMPWLRAKERARIAKIAAIESELDNFRDDRRHGGDVH